MRADVQENMLNIYCAQLPVQYFSKRNVYIGLVRESTKVRVRKKLIVSSRRAARGYAAGFEATYGCGPGGIWYL